MDTCVPNSSGINSTFSSPSPHSIYEQERKANFTGDCKVGVNSYMDQYGNGSFDDNELLDDRLEDCNLLFTTELLNSMTSTSSTFTGPVNTLCFNKLNTAESQDASALAQTFQLPADPDFLPELMNLDSNDSKFSLPNFDFESLTSNPPSSCHTPVPTAQSEVRRHDLSEFPSNNQNSKNSTINKDVTLSSPYSTASDNIGQDFRLKRLLMRQQQFPPRKAEPPVVVVAPVKVGDENKNNDLSAPFHSFKTEMKMEDETVRSLNTAANEMPPQTVPSFGFINRNSREFDSVKCEPLSPDNKRKLDLVSEPSVDEKCEDMKFLIKGGTTSSATMIKRKRYDSGSSWMSDDVDDYGDNNQYYDSDDDNSDLDPDLAYIKPGNCESLIVCGKKQKQYFWQYNVQAKGPKGTRLKLAVEAPADPHVLNGFEDPVFDEGNTSVAGIRHGGKARKGDGNEVSPNPFKLFKIGHQLSRLNRKINACQLGSDVPALQRMESRKEKNKLASRACRLKKKAQHEANKIKLHGLETEHGQINNILRLIWPQLRDKARHMQQEGATSQKMSCESSLTNQFNGYISSNLKGNVAGCTTDFVNDVILTVESGNLSGGLNIKSKKS